MITLTKAICRKLPPFSDRLGRELMIRIAPDGITIKTKGQKWATGLWLPWKEAHTHAVWLDAERTRAARRRRNGREFARNQVKLPGVA